jgi:hypothetical protein
VRQADSRVEREAESYDAPAMTRKFSRPPGFRGSRAGRDNRRGGRGRGAVLVSAERLTAEIEQSRKGTTTPASDLGSVEGASLFVDTMEDSNDASEVIERDALFHSHPYACRQKLCLLLLHPMIRTIPSATSSMMTPLKKWASRYAVNRSISSQIRSSSLRCSRHHPPRSVCPPYRSRATRALPTAVEAEAASRVVSAVVAA